MSQLFYLAGFWSWWAMWLMGPDQSMFLWRDVTFRDENYHTRMTKSLLSNTLTVEIFISFLCLGGAGKGWALELLDAAIGWVCTWVGVHYSGWFIWVGHYLGWVGVIRGVRVVIPFSLSGRHLVACSSLFNWSIGKIMFLPFFLCHRWLFRGHSWSWLIWFESGIDYHLGDIRTDQTGGLSLRCSPICIPTPMLETNVGFSNLFFYTNLLVGLGLDVGWARCLINLTWICIFADCCAEGFLVSLEWNKPDNLKLLNHSLGFFLIVVAKIWLLQYSDIVWIWSALRLWLFEVVGWQLHRKNHSLIYYWFGKDWVMLIIKLLSVDWCCNAQIMGGTKQFDGFSTYSGDICVIWGWYGLYRRLHKVCVSSKPVYISSWFATAWSWYRKLLHKCFNDSRGNLVIYPTVIAKAFSGLQHGHPNYNQLLRVYSCYWLGRTDFLYTLLVGPRGNIVIKDWDNFSMLQFLLVWKSMLWFYVWRVKLYERIQSKQRYHHSTGQTWACIWSRIFWVGFFVLWKLSQLSSKYWQLTNWYWHCERIKKLYNLRGCSRGIFVLSDWNMTHLCLLRDGQESFSLCCTQNSCYKVLALLIAHIGLLFGQLGLLGGFRVHCWDLRGCDGTCNVWLGWVCYQLLKARAWLELCLLYVMIIALGSGFCMSTGGIYCIKRVSQYWLYCAVSGLLSLFAVTWSWGCHPYGCSSMGSRDWLQAKWLLHLFYKHSHRVLAPGLLSLKLLPRWVASLFLDNDLKQMGLYCLNPVHRMLKAHAWVRCCSLKQQQSRPYGLCYGPHIWALGHDIVGYRHKFKCNLLSLWGRVW
ncbi:hypothetical protein Hanom_Chr00s000120g01623301 [Helianthus anomalus]